MTEGIGIEGSPALLLISAILGHRNGKERLHLPAREEDKPQEDIWKERDVRTLPRVWRSALQRKYVSNDL